MTKKIRDNKIIRASIISIIVNVLLTLSKVAIGFFSNSIAIMLDAVSSLSDVLASLVIIISVKLSGKAPNKKHPYGYGRIEYLSTSIISFIIIYVGIESLIESIKKLIHMEEPSYSLFSLLVIFIGVIAKFIVGKHIVHTGVEVNSDSLIAVGHESGHHAILSASTLITAIIFIFTDINLEAILGIIISAFIIESGIHMLLQTITHIIGRRIDTTLSTKIKKSISKMDLVHGAYDLELHNYGPNKLIGSIHIEVDDTLTANIIDKLSRNIQKDIYDKYSVDLSTIGIYSVNTKNDYILNLKKQISKIVMSHDHIMQMHGFYFDENEKSISFDIVVNFTSNDSKKLYNDLLKDLKEKYNDYEFYIHIDVYITD